MFYLLKNILTGLNDEKCINIALIVLYMGQLHVNLYIYAILKCTLI